MFNWSDFLEAAYRNDGVSKRVRAFAQRVRTTAGLVLVVLVRFFTIGGGTGTRNWVVAVLAGISLISIFNIIGTRAHVADVTAFVLIRLSVPLFVIGWYGANGTKLARANPVPALRAAQVGRLADNIYFLGFLFTLWALIDAFVIQRMTIAEAVFRTFGYALVTTASGMFCRLVLLQTVYSEEETTFQSDIDLLRQVANFNNNLSSAAQALADFKTAWCQSLTASADAMNRGAKAIETQSAALLIEMASFPSKVAEQIQRDFESALTLHRTRLDQTASAAAEHLAQTLQPSLARLESEARTVAESAVSVHKIVSDAAASAQQSILTSVSKLSASVTEATTTARKSVNDAVVSLQQSIRADTGQLTATVTHNEQAVSSALSGLEERVRQFSLPRPDMIERSLQDQVSRINTQLASGASRLDAVIAKIPGIVRDAARGVGHPRRVLWQFWKKD
jgi:hypothetical protein